MFNSFELVGISEIVVSAGNEMVFLCIKEEMVFRKTERPLPACALRTKGAITRMPSSSAQLWNAMTQ